jgi:hypothetical protein
MRPGNSGVNWSQFSLSSPPSFREGPDQVTFEGVTGGELVTPSKLDVQCIAKKDSLKNNKERTEESGLGYKG